MDLRVATYRRRQAPMRRHEEMLRIYGYNNVEMGTAHARSSLSYRSATTSTTH